MIAKNEAESTYLIIFWMSTVESGMLSSPPNHLAVKLRCYLKLLISIGKSAILSSQFPESNPFHLFLTFFFIRKIYLPFFLKSGVVLSAFSRDAGIFLVVFTTSILYLILKKKQTPVLKKNGG